MGWELALIYNHDKEVTTTCVPFVSWQRDPKNLQIPCSFLAFVSSNENQHC